jgi:hypothetical protein
VTKDTHDRDAVVGRLLPGTLARGLTESGDACLDAETLAAWADHALDARELAAAETHAADCGRCQAMLAAVMKTAPAMPDAPASAWRIPSIRWIVPLTAAAAALIVWVVVPARESPVNVPRLRPTIESTPAPSTPPATSDLQLPAPPAASRPAGREGETLERDTNVGPENKTAPSPDVNAGLDETALSADARREKARAASEAAVSTPAARAPASAANAFSVGAPEPVVVSSNPAIRWRILPGGAVQRSADGGSTWQTQSTGVTATLSAGASPSPSVCWLVGPDGIVLLSTDGGTWKRVAFPEAVHLIAVRATDDQTATVTTADAREWVTGDGGRTWTRAP